MINKLSFYTQPFEIEEGCCMHKYLAFYFQIDGKTIQSPDDTYNPANCFDITDDEAKKYNLVVLWHCTCGVWGCSSIVARVSEQDGNLIRWDVGCLHWEADSTYYFDKDEYNKVMSEIIEVANRQIEIEATDNND